MNFFAHLMKNKGVTTWISNARTLFPPALKNFGIDPDRIIFVDLEKERDVTWAMEEALKCGALTAVVGEIRDLNFTVSRRLQLAVEESRVTGFILRPNPRNLNTTACVSRWKITPMPSETEDDLPGIGFPRWKVDLSGIGGLPGIESESLVLAEKGDEYWFTTDPAVVHVPVDTAPGREHRVQLLLGLSIPYILTGPDRVPLVAPSSTDKTLTAAGARP